MRYIYGVFKMSMYLIFYVLWPAKFTLTIIFGNLFQFRFPLGILTKMNLELILKNINKRNKMLVKIEFNVGINMCFHLISPISTMLVILHLCPFGL